MNVEDVIEMNPLQPTKILIAYVNCTSREFKSGLPGRQEQAITAASVKLGYSHIKAFAATAQGRRYYFGRDATQMLEYAVRTKQELGEAVQIDFCVESRWVFCSSIHGELYDLIQLQGRIYTLDELLFEAAREEYGLDAA